MADSFSVYGSFVCLYVYALFVCSAQEASRVCHSPWTLSADGYELPCGFWESNPGPLEDQPVPLITNSSLRSFGFALTEPGLLGRSIRLWSIPGALAE